MSHETNYIAGQRAQQKKKTLPEAFFCSACSGVSVRRMALQTGEKTRRTKNTRNKKTRGAKKKTFLPGEGSIMIGKYLILFSGVEPESVRSIQGVGVVLNPEMRRAWENADSFCEYGGESVNPYQA